MPSNQAAFQDGYKVDEKNMPQGTATYPRTEKATGWQPFSLQDMDVWLGLQLLHESRLL